MGKPGKIVHSLKKPLGLEMKGSPYPMTASQDNTFGPSGSNPNPVIFNAIKAADAKKSKSKGPEFAGALLAGAGKLLAKKAVSGAIAKTVAKKAVSKIGGSIIKKGLSEVGAKAFGAGSNISSLVKDVPAGPKSKTGMGKALSTIGSSITEGVRGLGEGIAGKAGGSPKGFGDKVKNYIGSLDLITNSNTDGSLRKETDKPSTAADSDKNITDLTSNEANSTVPDNSGSIPNTPVGNDNTIEKSIKASIDQTPEKSIPEQAGVKDYSKLPGMNMEGPLNKLKNMCRR